MLSAGSQEPCPCDGPLEAERVVAALERIRPSLKRLMAVFRMSPEDAEDLAQNLAIAALTKGREAVRLESWLLGAAWNLCRMHYRRKAYRDAPPLEEIAEPLAPSEEEKWIGRIDLDRGISTLAPHHQTVFRLLVAGHPKKEVAARTGYSEKGLRWLILRNTARLSSHYSGLNARAQSARRAQEALPQ